MVQCYLIFILNVLQYILLKDGIYKSFIVISLEKNAFLQEENLFWTPYAYLKKKRKKKKREKKRK